MTTTVRILGSRAREQVPGTSITLLAPGFRGSLAQIAPVASGTARATDLPFADAANGADVMLASQLSMHLEARPPDDGPELRSRSAVAAYPRLIVPRRNGVAYALLQTDEAGRSTFVMPLTRDDDEAVFPLGVAREGATRRTLRVFMWAASPVLGPGAADVMSRWERMHRPHRLLALAADGSWCEPDAQAVAQGPCLLLLHGTFATPQSAFDDWLAHESFETVRARFGGRCLAFAHPTLAASLEENLEFLVASLPAVESLDIVAHGRGGLLARAFAARRRVALGRVVLVGTPNLGTPLARRESLPRFLDGYVAPLARMSQRVALPLLEGALSMARFVALGLPASLAGLEALEPESESLRSLQEPRETAQHWFTVGARYAAAQGERADEFDSTPNDLVVPSESCHLPTAQLADSLHLEGERTHHHGYFADEHVRERLAAWLA